MKKSTLTLTIIFLLGMRSLFAATLADEKSMKDVTDKIMEKVAAGNFLAAFELMKPYSPLSAAEIDSAALQTKTLREQFGQRYGDAVGYDFIDSRKVGTALLRLRYIEKTKHHAMPCVFYFYKTGDGWILNSFDWNDKLQALFMID